MAYILHLETATKTCSVAVSENDKLISIKETSTANSHSSLITLFAEEVIKSAGITFNDLSAVCVSKGPGSYTGLRIGVSTAKGFCYALNIPLIAVNTLQSMANYYLQSHSQKLNKKTLLCPMLDARRMEVYSAFFDNNLNFIKDTSADIIEEQTYSDYLSEYRLIFFGDGAEKCRQILSHNNAVFANFTETSARGMISFAWQRYQNKEFEDIAYFEPFYLKDFIATIPKNILNPNK